MHPLAAGHTWAVELPNLQNGENVLILGPGPRGLACPIAATRPAQGGSVSPVCPTIVTVSSWPSGSAPTSAIDAEKEDGGAIAEAIGRRPDIVVDVTSDDPEALFTALDLVRSGGRVILASTKGNRAFHFISDVLVAKQLTIRGAMGGLDRRVSVGLEPDRHRPRIDRSRLASVPALRVIPRTSRRPPDCSGVRSDLRGRHVLK